MPVIGEKGKRFMKKKTSKNTKIQKPKFKKVTLKGVKESTVLYRTNKNERKLLNYTDEKIGKIEIVKDFLPAPDELALKDSTVKVTLNLSKTSVDFFKALAQKNKSQYQKVIRNLLDSYTANYVRK